MRVKPKVRAASRWRTSLVETLLEKNSFTYHHRERAMKKHVIADSDLHNVDMNYYLVGLYFVGLDQVG